MKLKRRNWLLLAASLSFLLQFNTKAAARADSPATKALSPAGQALPLRLYLPAIERVQAGIYGYTILNGAPLTGALVELRFFDGAGWSSAGVTTTGTGGQYVFGGAPTLGAGQVYYVLYRSGEFESDRLSVWGSRELETYPAGGSIDLGQMDITNIALLSPGHATSINLPFMFQWTTRPHVLESYELNIFDAADGDPYFYNEPALGYTDRFTLNGIPAGFSTGVEYSWTVWMYGPDGSYGISHYRHDLTFLNVGIQGLPELVPTCDRAQPGRSVRLRDNPREVLHTPAP